MDALPLGRRAAKHAQWPIVISHAVCCLLNCFIIHRLVSVRFKHGLISWFRFVLANILEHQRLFFDVSVQCEKLRRSGSVQVRCFGQDGFPPRRDPVVGFKAG